MIRAIIFDFGGVIGKIGNHRFVSSQLYKKYQVDEEELLSVIKENWDLAKTNEISSKDFWNNIAKYIHHDPILFRKEFLELSNEIDEEMLDLIKHLKNKYVLALLSNHIEDWLSEIIEENSLQQVFHLIITSYDMNIAKPEKKLFEVTREKLGVLFEECLFIDDQEKNTIAAAALGMKTILYKNKSINDLKIEMRAFDIAV